MLIIEGHYYDVILTQMKLWKVECFNLLKCKNDVAHDNRSSNDMFHFETVIFIRVLHSQLTMDHITLVNRSIKVKAQNQFYFMRVINGPYFKVV